MIRILFIFSSCILLLAACSTLKASSGVDTALTNDGTKDHHPICFNHAVLVLDSATYYAAVHSEFINRFAYSQERQLNGYKGFYLFGKTNYIELFHPKSFDGYEEEEGGIWINLAPLKANYIKQLNWEHFDFITFEPTDDYLDLSLIVSDSSTPITTWEMTKEHYESWTKKTYSDTMDFLPVDYLSAQDTDSSANYVMNDVVGIGLRINTVDSLAVISYLNVVGFTSVTEQNGQLRISNNDQFIELYFSEDLKTPTIKKFYIRLNKSVDPATEVIGTSRVDYHGNLAIWSFEDHLTAPEKHTTRSTATYEESMNKRVGKTVVVTGKTVNAKLGALLITNDGHFIWMDNMDQWPEGYYLGDENCKTVKVKGRLIRKYDLPVFIEEKDSPSQSGIPVPEGTNLKKASRRFLLKKATWEVLED